MLADNQNRLSWRNVAARRPVLFAGDSIEAALDDLLAPRKSIATAHGRTLWQTLAFKLEVEERSAYAEVRNLPDNEQALCFSRIGAFLLLVGRGRHSRMSRARVRLRQHVGTRRKNIPLRPIFVGQRLYEVNSARWESAGLGSECGFFYCGHVGVRDSRSCSVP
jgi:hypothetical protein